VVSIAILFILPFTQSNSLKRTYFYPLNQFIFWGLINIVILLTWIGARPAEDPYILVGQIITIIYFLYFLINPVTSKIWDTLIK
jgi:ubiquinol-cytochrome c reductase cytochrome b subunit